MIKLICFLLLALPVITLAQNIGIGTTVPDASAILELQSTSKGLLIPRMTNAQMNAIVTPANGLLVFNTTDNSLYIRKSTGWVNVNTTLGGWQTSGNAGTDTSINFIGTTDNRAVIFRTNNKKAGLLQDTLSPYGGNTSFGIGSLSSSSEGRDNVALGALALNKALNGTYNVAVGKNSLGIQTVTAFNTAIGAYCMDSTTSGIQNTAIGAQAMRFNTGGSNNVAVGLGALYENGSGTANVALGYLSMIFNQSGTANIAVGPTSLRGNTTGNSNVAVGASSLFSNTTGTRNIGIGHRALYTNTTSSYLIAIGDSALFNNDIGFANTAVGSKTLYNNTWGSYNTAVGFESLDSNNSGYLNVAIGVWALKQNVSGSSNIAVGSYAGYYNNGTGNVFLGDLSGQQSTGSGNIFLGNRAGQHSKSSNKLYIDNSANDSTRAFIYGDMFSDSLLINASTNITGFTRLGKRSEMSPSIKVMKLTVNLPATQGASNFVNHGLTQSKILAISALATVNGGYEIPASFLQSGFEFTVNADNGRIAVNTISGQSANILNAPVKILVTYEE